MENRLPPTGQLVPHERTIEEELEDLLDGPVRLAEDVAAGG